MSRLLWVKRKLYSTPIIGRIYGGAALIYKFFKWKRECWRGRKYMAESYSGKFDFSHPPRIPGLRITELAPPPLVGMVQNNPTICRESGGCRIYWRITNWDDVPTVDFLGRRKKRNVLRTGRLFSRTRSGFLEVNNGEISREIKDSSFVLSLDPAEGAISPIEHSINEDFDPSLTYEDPRVLPADSNLLSFTAVEQGRTGTRFKTRSAVGLYDFNTRKLNVLNIPGQDVIEKNWVLAAASSESVWLLTRSEPHTVLVVDRITGELKNELKNEASGKAFLNGGSPFVLVDDSYYLRVARYRVSLPTAFKVHVSHIVKHDLEFNEITRSKPFVFQKYAYEVCNGMEYDGENFYFSWGENDVKMFVGSIPKNALLTWLDQNISTKN